MWFGAVTRAQSDERSFGDGNSTLRFLNWFSWLQWFGESGNLYLVVWIGEWI